MNNAVLYQSSSISGSRIKTESINNLLIKQDRKVIQEQDYISSLVNASYIQKSIFGDALSFTKNIPYKSFLLYLPKDIVSGDFYLTYKILNKIIIIVGDCTGHGVPGAMLSVFANNAFNKAVIENRITNPKEILKHVSNNFAKTFNIGTMRSNIGMDVSVCCVDTTTHLLEASSIGNSIWVNCNEEIIELKANRINICSSSSNSVSLISHNYQLKKGDNLYLFTDGFQDQFGNKSESKQNGTKFLRKRMKKLFSIIGNLPVFSQNKILKSTFENWKGDLEQTDDITVLGITIN